VSDRLATLEKLLADQVGLSEKLLGVMEREKEAAVGLSLDGLRQALFEKETLLGTLTVMEQSLIKHLRAHAAALGIPETEATVTRILERIGGDRAARLLPLRDELRALHQRIQDLNVEERHLMEHSLRSAQLSLRIIGNRLRPAGVYSRSGSVDSTQGVRLVSKGA